MFNSNIIDLALSEDISQGDVTSEILIPPQLQGKAFMLVKARGVLAGNDIAREVFLKVDPSLKVELLIKDGTAIKPGDIVATISGRVSSILKAERVALNFLQRLSGIASQTAQYVVKTRDYHARIVDTRKTTPGLRALEKYAVRMGGGQNHRMHMGDAVLIKDNHIAALRKMGMSLKDIVGKAKEKAPKDMTVEVEVTTPEEAREAAQAGATMIMFDNMSPDEMRRALSLLPKGVKTEASGGITLDNVAAVAMTGVDIISIGALTHSTKSLDISLELETLPLK
ncbi:MAG: carboxylating nicotinate-nucleotide diphosphorylase [Dehalococcoidales bacterium]|nr:carboxylating nicotinate-nucleotide diphosphorylase [Dehalococcoidales bacterium]